MKQSNHDNFNEYNVLSYMFNRPKMKSQSKVINGYRAISGFFSNPIRVFTNLVKDIHEVKIAVRVAIVIVGLLALTKLLGSDYQEPVKTSPIAVVEQPIAKIDTIANLPQPEVINTANLDNSLSKAKAVFDSFPQVDGENQIATMKRLNKHIIDSKPRNPI